MPLVRLLLAVTVSILALRAVPLFALDCNANGVEDSDDIVSGTATDCNVNGVPDECDVPAVPFRAVDGTLRVGRIPRAVALRDVDGDGDADLLTGNQNTNRSSTVSVLLNDGDGAFSAKVDFPAGERLSAMVVSDLDGDGSLDVATANVTDVAVLRGGGDGNLSEPLVFSADDASARALTAADLDADGTLDLVTANLDTGSLSVLRGQGEADWVVAGKPAVGDQPNSVDATDLDGDGALDLLTANRGDSTISVLRGRGDGTFGEAESIDAGVTRPFSVLARDFDQDGVPDAALATTERVAVFLGGPGGELQPSAVFALPDAVNSANSLVAVDIDSDSDVDLVSGFRNREQIVLLRNHGASPFAAGVDVVSQGVIPSSTALAAGDLDGNGEPDLAFVVQSRVALVLRGEGGKRIIPFASAGFTQNPTVHCLGIADFDGDADLDVVTGNNSTTGGLVAYYGDGAGDFSEPVLFDTPQGNPFWIAVGDVDGDGSPDVAASLAPPPGADCEQCVALVVRNDGTGDLSNGTGYPVGGAPRHVAIADLDGDSRPEVITALPGRGTINILPNQGDGTFGERLEVQAGSSPFATAFADFDGDGRVDIVTSNLGSGDLSLLRHGEDGLFTERGRYPVTGGPRYVAAADLDGDGRVDLVAANERERTVSVLWNAGGGEAPRFEGPFDSAVDGQPHSVITVDIDDDGDHDLVTAHEFEDTLSILFNNGARSFALSVPYPVGLGPRLAVSGDVDGDGDTDLVSGDHGTKGITVLLNQTPPVRDFLPGICTQSDFLEVTFAPGSDTGKERLGKYIAPARQDASLLSVTFQNANRFLLQSDFLRVAFSERFGMLTSEDYEALTERRTTRDYFAGSITSVRVDGSVVYTFTADVADGPDEVLQLEEVTELHARLGEVFTLSPLLYEPDTDEGRALAETWSEAPFEVFLSDSGGEEPAETPPPLALEVPEGTVLCGVFPKEFPGRTLSKEHDSKSQIELRAGEYQLMVADEPRVLDLIAEVRFGPGQDVLVPEEPGIVQSFRIPAGGGETLYRFGFTQRFTLPGGEILELRIFRLDFRVAAGQTAEERLVLDDRYATFDLSMEAVLGAEPVAVFSSCSYTLLPRWEMDVTFSGGGLSLVERFAPTEDEASTGPAACVAARVTLDGAEEQHVTDYWQLVYAARRHNREAAYWIFLDPALTPPGTEGAVEVIELRAPEPSVPPDVGGDFPGAVRLYGPGFELRSEAPLLSFLKEERASPQAARFQRGDVDGDGAVQLTDAVRTLEYVFQNGVVPGCVKAADTDDNGRVNLADAIEILTVLFRGGGEISEPRVCGLDPTDDGLRCESHERCL